ncbi:UbiH/UbiF family hydroxylase [Quatrionicoccus australiensis]|uniref:UbiH/UbiF family hydroxylase n=1 Tax=Quatrionicoccus australiensis TaxID=138118 RepID=UPI001CF999C8|nr:UbiH/UbiF family hydroxylase [Quatrionicoccus australiensis]MCB4359409.1 UbiH/UbiF family hydroxylase [Quatrionicoccus australiensis]
MQHFDLIIVGGGLAGASLAVALRDTRLRIALVEHQPPVRPAGWDARIYAISPSNVEFLESIGAWKHLDAARMAPIRGMSVAGDAGGKLAFSAFDTGVSELGWILESSLMACELWESAKRQANLTIFCPARPEQLEFRHDAALLHLADGTVLSARLLVAADGRDSWVRRAAGLAAVNTPYGEKGLVANFACEKPHHGIAHQWFRDDGVLAYLPLPGNRISIVWSTPDEHADQLCALAPEILCDRVAEAGGHVLGKLELLTPAAAFALRLMRVPQTVAPRLALVGDAGHGIHPLSGHGINLGFQDARELAALLAATQPWHDIGDLRFLQRYQRARREETLLMQTTTDTLRRFFRASTPGLRPLRNIGLTLTDGLPFIKNALVRYALGAL